MAPRKEGPKPKVPMTGDGMMVSKRHENYCQRQAKKDKDALKYLKNLNEKASYILKKLFQNPDVYEQLNLCSIN